MSTPILAARAAEATSGLPSSRRRARLNRLTAGISAAVALVILVGAMMIGGSLTRLPTASADEDQASRALGHAPIVPKLTGFQLPTI